MTLRLQGDAEEITKLKAQLADAKVNEELLKQRNEELRTSLATSKEDFEALQQQVSLPPASTITCPS